MRGHTGVLLKHKFSKLETFQGRVDADSVCCVKKIQMEIDDILEKRGGALKRFCEYKHLVIRLFFVIN
jgi:hypothetical protein